MNQNKFEEALQLVQTLEHQEGLTPEENLTCLILKSQIMTKKGEIPQSLEIAEAAFNLSESVGNPLLKVEAIIAKAEALRFWPTTSSPSKIKPASTRTQFSSAMLLQSPQRDLCKCEWPTKQDRQSHCLLHGP